jgi:predicted ester cyclase
LAAEYAEDCVLDSPAYGMVRGRDGVEKSFHRWFGGFPDCAFEFGDFLIQDDRVVHTLTMRGMDTGGFLGQAATGKPFRFFIVTLMKIERGQITYERRVYDVSGLMLQLATDDDVATEAGRVYRSTLERARTEHELKTAAQIQQALLPERQRQRAGFEIAATSLPCRAIGGDFLDYFDLPNGTFAFVVGDVAGKRPCRCVARLDAAGDLYRTV